MSLQNRLYNFTEWSEEITDSDGRMEIQPSLNLMRFADALNHPRWPNGWEWRDEDGDLETPAWIWWSRLMQRAGLRRFSITNPQGYRNVKFISPEQRRQAERDLFSCAEISLNTIRGYREFPAQGDYAAHIASLRAAIRLVLRRFLDPGAPVHGLIHPGQENRETSRIRRFLDPGTKRRAPGVLLPARQLGSAGEILQNIPTLEEERERRRIEDEQPLDEPLPEAFSELGKGVLNVLTDHAQDSGEAELFPPHDPTPPMFGAQSAVRAESQMREFAFFYQASAEAAGMEVPPLRNVDDQDRVGEGLFYKYRPSEAALDLSRNPQNNPAPSSGIKIAQERYYAWSWLPFNPGRLSIQRKDYREQITDARNIPFTADYKDDPLLIHKEQPGLTFGRTTWDPEISDNYRPVVDENGSVWMEVNVGGMLARSVGDNEDGSLTQEFKPFVFGQFDEDGKTQIGAQEDGVARASQLGLGLPIIQELTDEGVDPEFIGVELAKRMNERYATRTLAEVIGDRYREYQIEQNGPNRERWTPVIPFYERGPNGATREDDVGMFRVFEEEWRLTRQIHRQIFMNGLVVEVAAAWENEDGTFSKGPSTLTGGFFGPYLDSPPLVRMPPVRFRTPFRETDAVPRKLFPVMRIVGGANQFFLWQGSTGGLLGEFAMTRFGQWLGRNSEAVLVATIIITLLTLGLGSGGAAAAGGGGGAAGGGGGAAAGGAGASQAGVQAGQAAAVNSINQGVSAGLGATTVDASKLLASASDAFGKATGVTVHSSVAGGASQFLTTTIATTGGQVVGTVSVNTFTGAISVSGGAATFGGATVGTLGASYTAQVSALIQQALIQQSVLAQIGIAGAGLGGGFVLPGTDVVLSTNITGAITSGPGSATILNASQEILNSVTAGAKAAQSQITSIFAGLPNANLPIGFAVTGGASPLGLTGGGFGAGAALKAGLANLSTTAGALAQSAPILGASQTVAGLQAALAAGSLSSSEGLLEAAGITVEDLAGAVAADVGPIPPTPTAAFVVPATSQNAFTVRVAQLAVNLLQIAFPGGLPHESDQAGTVPASFNLATAPWFFLTNKDDRNNRADSAPKEYVPLDLPGALPRGVMRGLELISNTGLENTVSVNGRERQAADARTHAPPEMVPGPDFPLKQRYDEARNALAFPHVRKSQPREFFITLFGGPENRAAVADVLGEALLQDAPAGMVRSKLSLMDGQPVPITDLPARDIGYLFGPAETTRVDLENIVYASRATIPNITAVLRALMERLEHYTALNDRASERNTAMAGFRAAVERMRVLRASYIAARNAGLAGVQNAVLDEAETQAEVCRRFIRSLPTLPSSANALRFNFTAERSTA